MYKVEAWELGERALFVIIILLVSPSLQGASATNDEYNIGDAVVSRNL